MKGAGGEHRPQCGPVAVGVGELEVMAGHRLVEREIVDRVIVIFAEERGRLRIRPFRRDRRDGVEGDKVLLERPGAVAISERHALLELGHGDDPDRRVRDGDQLLLADEGRGLSQSLGGLGLDSRARRAVGVSELERGLDRFLLLVRGRPCRERRRRRAAGEDRAGDFVHLLPSRRDGRRCPALDLGPIERGGQGETELGIIEAGAEPEVALGLRDQDVVEPELMLGDRGLQALHRRIEAAGVGGIQLASVRREHLLDDLDDAAILPGDRRRENLRDARRNQVRARLGKQSGHLLHPPDRGFETGLPGREVARRQGVQRPASRLVVDLRVPGPALQRLVGPDRIKQGIVEQSGVDLVLAA